jgi:transcription initiation factor TFIIA small subunit
MSAAEVDEVHFEHYRESKLGTTLMEVINELVTENRIPPQVAMRTLLNFDRIVAEVLANHHYDNNVYIKGHLDTYNEIYPVYNFVVTNATVMVGSGWKTAFRPDLVLDVERLHIVACKAKKGK